MKLGLSVILRTWTLKQGLLKRGELIGKKMKDF
jgi:hypothetical protein